MTLYDDPNRQALGLDPAWVEGTGGSGAEPKGKAKAKDDAEPKAKAKE